MKFRTAAIAGTIAAGATTTVWIGVTSASSATTRQIVVAPKRHDALAAGPKRVFLSSAQVSDALKSGTLDRPVRSLLRVPSRLEYGDFVWDDSKVPSGPTWIRVDLRSQLLSVFRAGHEIGTAVIVYGGDNKPTPAGKLHILERDRVHRSSLYDAEMPYTLRLTGDGVSIHGSVVRYGAASHGCIGVPVAFARHLFDAAHVGDDVVIIPAWVRRS